MQDIQANLMPLMTSSSDHISWFLSPGGEFVLKDAYKLACIEDGTIPLILTLVVRFGRLLHFQKSSAFFSNATT